MKQSTYWSAAGCGALYLVMQGMCGAALLIIVHKSSITAVAWATLLAQVLTCLVLWMMKKFHLPDTFNPNITRWKHALLAFVAVVIGIVASNLLNEQLHLPDLVGAQLKEMANNPIGILAITIVGPIAEELIFREAAQGSMLRAGIAPWKTILFSALCFGLIHINPAQVLFAFIVGLMLGIVYYCSGNIVITSLLHIANNSLSVYEMHRLGDRANDFSYAEWMGLHGTSLWMLICGLTLISIVLFRKYWLSGASHNPVWKMRNGTISQQPEIENNMTEDASA